MTRTPPPAGTPGTPMRNNLPNVFAFALLALGDDSCFLKVLLTSVGGGVQQVVLTRFDQANRLGREDKAPDGSTRPLDLIPGYLRPLGRNLTDEPEHVDLLPNLTEADF